MKKPAFVLWTMVLGWGLFSHSVAGPWDRAKGDTQGAPTTQRDQADRKEPAFLPQQPARQAPAAHPEPPVRQPVVINIDRPSAGRDNRAFQPVEPPAIRQPDNSQNHSQDPRTNQPLMERTDPAQTQSPSRPDAASQPRQQWPYASQPAVSAQPPQSLMESTSPAQTQSPSRPDEAIQPRQQWPYASQPAASAQPPQSLMERVKAGQALNPAFRASNVVHHHPYTQGYVRKKLQNLGVKDSPRYITDRAELVATDRSHSAIRFPVKGPDNQVLSAKQVTSRHLNDGLVRQLIARVSGGDGLGRIQADAARETRTNQFYWHKDDGFNYCHFIDASGYNWYGWYQDDQFFWTRSYAGRWWSYDSDSNRWVFWDDGFWWWQDPYHLGDLYCYTPDGYVPANSANDQVVVTTTDEAGGLTTNSPDGTRAVRVYGDTQDAFLYDLAQPPTFDPVYLASGVQSVQFSDTSNGRALQMVLKLKDGSFDMFDNQGAAYLSARADDGTPSVTVNP